MLNQFTHERFVEFLRNATLNDIQAMTPENLPEGVDMDVLFEAPMELSDAVRKLVLQAQTLQSQNKEGNILKALGTQGKAILAAANAPTPSPIQQAFNKQQKAVRDLKVKLELKEDPVVKGILNKLLTQLEHGSKQIQSQKTQAEQHLNLVNTILKDKSQANLHASAEHIQGKLQKQIDNLNKDIASFSKEQESATQQHTTQLKNKLKTLFANAQKLDTHIPKKRKKKVSNMNQDVQQALILTINSLKGISHASLSTHLSALLTDISLDPDTEDTTKINHAFNLAQWFCCTNEAVINLERKAHTLTKGDPFIEDQITKQQDILHVLEKNLSHSTHFHLSAIQAKQAWTDELKTVR